MRIEPMHQEMKFEEEGIANHRPKRRKFVHNLIAGLARRLLRMEMIGGEHIPTEGGVLLTTNHLSRIDTGILLLNPTRADIAALVTDKYKSYPLIRFMVEAMPHIWIDRSKADFTAFSSAIRYLKSGGVLGIAPEGTRSRNGALIEGKPGAVMIADRSGVPIVPVGIAGTDRFQHNVRRFRRTDVVVRFGRAFHLPARGEEDRAAYMDRCTEETMCRIAAQLPEDYHGIYTGHPRIQEILEEQSQRGERNGVSSG